MTESLSKMDADVSFRFREVFHIYLQEHYAIYVNC